MDATKMEALGGLMDEVDAEGPATPEQQREEQQAQGMEESARQWGAIVYMVGNAAAMIAPELRQVYSEEACMNWGRAMNPVAEKYGWNGANSIPELGLLIATAGLIVPSVFAIRARLAAVNEGKEKTTWLGSMRQWWLDRKARRNPPTTAMQAEPVPDGS